MYLRRVTNPRSILSRYTHITTPLNLSFVLPPSYVSSLLLYQHLITSLHPPPIPSLRRQSSTSTGGDCQQNGHTIQGQTRFHLLVGRPQYHHLLQWTETSQSTQTLRLIFPFQVRSNSNSSINAFNTSLHRISVPSILLDD